MDTRFEQIRKKYETYGWDSLTQDEKTYYRVNYRSMVDPLNKSILPEVTVYSNPIKQMRSAAKHNYAAEREWLKNWYANQDRPIPEIADLSFDTPIYKGGQEFKNYSGEWDRILSEQSPQGKEDLEEDPENLLSGVHGFYTNPSNNIAIEAKKSLDHWTTENSWNTYKKYLGIEPGKKYTKEEVEKLKSDFDAYVTNTMEGVSNIKKLGEEDPKIGNRNFIWDLYRYLDVVTEAQGYLTDEYKSDINLTEEDTRSTAIHELTHSTNLDDYYLNATKTLLIRELENKFGVTFKSKSGKDADQNAYTIEGRKLSKAERAEMNKILKDNNTTLGSEMYYSSSETYPRIMSLRHAADMTPQTEITDEFLDSLDTKEGHPAQHEYRELKDIYGKDEVKRMLKDFVNTDVQTPRKDTYAFVDNKNNTQDMKHKNKYALGGILQGAQLGMDALGVLDQLLTQKKVPMKVDRTSFNKGGDIPLSSEALKIKGRHGVDTNPRMVDGQQIYLTQDEVVDTATDPKFVYSDDIKDPISGNTYAEEAEKYSKKIGKAEKRIRKQGYDPIAQNTIKRMKGFKQGLKEGQEAIKTARGMSEGVANAYQIGGPIQSAMAYSMGLGMENSFWNNFTQGAAPLLDGIVPLARNTNRMGAAGLSNDVAENAAIASREDEANRIADIDFQRSRNNLSSNNLPLPINNVVARQRGYGTDVRNMSNALPAGPNTSGGLGSTFGDIAYFGGKGLEFLGKGIMATQPVEQISVRPFKLDPQRISATPALQANTRNYRSGLQSLDTGNASLDRVAKANFAGQKMSADAQALVQAQAAQRQMDLNVDQYNSQMTQYVEQANAQAQAAKAKALDNIFTSIGNVGQDLQNKFNTDATNAIQLQALNRLSAHYGIDIPTLKKLMKNDPAKFDAMLLRINSKDS